MARAKDLWKDPKRKGHGKRWLAIWQLGDGTESSKAFHHERQALKYAQAQEVDIDRGTYISPKARRVTVGAWCDTWIAGYATRRPSTVRQARVHIAQIKAEFDRESLTSVRPSGVKAWTSRLKTEGYEASYVYALHKRLSQIMADAVHDGLIGKNPCSRKTSPGGGKQRPYVITTEQLWQLYAVMPADLQIAVLLGALAGLRVAEACGLRPGDVDLALGMVHPRVQYPAEPLKTEISQTAIPVPHSLTTELIAHVAMWPGDTVLADADGRQVAPWRIERAIRSARAQVPGLPAGFRYHDLRHYLASFLIAHGADVKVVQARLRHASAKTTLDTYGHLWPDRDESTRTALEAVFGARPEQGRNKPGADVAAPQVSRDGSASSRSTSRTLRDNAPTSTPVLITGSELGKVIPSRPAKSRRVPKSAGTQPEQDRPTPLVSGPPQRYERSRWPLATHLTGGEGTMKNKVTNQASTLVLVCKSCCADPQLVPACKRCSGTAVDPNPAGAPGRLAWLPIRPDLPGGAFHAVPTTAGLAMVVKLTDGSWQAMAIMRGPDGRLDSGPSWWSKPVAARHGAQRWAERAIATGQCPPGGAR